MDETAIKREYKRLTDLLKKADIQPKYKDALAPVIDNLAWQKVKLDETRELMKTQAVICTYDNGGGQKGIRENPIFKGYENLWKAYLAGLEKVLSYLPKDMQEEIKEDNKNVLMQVLEMKK